MLIEFSVENYLSFNERVTFSMAAAPELDASDALLENTFEAPGGIRLLKSALIYGANASGKSNLLQAIFFSLWFVENSARETQVGDPINVTPFKFQPGSESQGSSFELVWLARGKRYRYRFTANRSRVLEESFFQGPPHGQEVELFRRNTRGIIVSEAFSEARDLAPRTRDNALFLSVAAQFNALEAGLALDWFLLRAAVSGLDDEGLLPFTVRRIKEKEKEQEWAAKLLLLATEADFGIIGIDVSDQGELTFHHRATDDKGQPVGDVTLSWNEESEGTRRFIALGGPLLDAVKKSMTLFIDEFDARLHPRLARAIVQLFHGDANPDNAQLVAATHDTNLLDRRLLRRDQIWFTEKDGRGATQLYSLAEFDLPPGATYERDYLLGKYGAVPVIGELVQSSEKK